MYFNPACFFSLNIIYFLPFFLVGGVGIFLNFLDIEIILEMSNLVSVNK